MTKHILFKYSKNYSSLKKTHLLNRSQPAGMTHTLKTSELCVRSNSVKVPVHSKTEWIY